jgi:hypothetical protein
MPAGFSTDIPEWKSIIVWPLGILGNETRLVPSQAAGATGCFAARASVAKDMLASAKSLSSAPRRQFQLADFVAGAARIGMPSAAAPPVDLYQGPIPSRFAAFFRGPQARKRSHEYAVA